MSDLVRRPVLSGNTWLLVTLLAVINLSAYADRSIVAAVAPLLQSEFALTDAFLGAIAGPIFALPNIGALILVAAFGLPRRADFLIVVAIGVWTAAMVAFALAPDPLTLSLSRGAMGVGQAIFAPAALAILASLQPTRAPLAISTWTASAVLGRAGGTLVVGTILLLAATLGFAEADRWRVVSLLMVAPNLVLMAIVAGVGPILLPPQKRAFGLRVELGESRGFLVGYLVAACGCVLATQSAAAWAPSALNRDFGIDAANAAIMAGSASLLGAPAGHFVAGLVSARHPFSRTFPLAMIVAGVSLASFCGFALERADGPTGALLSLAGLAFTAGFAAVIALVRWQMMLLPEMRIAGGALYLATVTLVGSSLGPLLTGVLNDTERFGGLAGSLFASILLATAVALAGASIAILSRQRRAVLSREISP